MKTQTRTLLDSSTTPLWLGWLLLLPLLATSLPAQTGPELTVEQSTNGTYLLSWQVTTNSYIVLSATNVGGPWIPRLESVTEAAGTQHMTVAAPHQTEYFKLAQGYIIEDDFDDGDLEGWAIIPEDPQLTNCITVEATNGQLHIYGDCSAVTNRQLMLIQTNATLAMLNASVEILGWDNTAGNRIPFALLTRVDPRILDPTPLAYMYAAGVEVNPPSYPHHSDLWMYKQGPLVEAFGGSYVLVNPKMQPSEDYRLESCLFHNGVILQMIGSLFHSSGAFMEDKGTSDGGEPLPPGFVGLWVNESGPSGAMDFWFDNFRAVGTKFETAPPPPSPPTNWVLVWSDEFEAPDIDLSKWSHKVSAQGGGSSELQYDTDRLTNSFIQDGCLVIQALEETYTGPQGTREYTSARLRTLNKGDWTCGRFEARMKLPYGRGLFPKFWMLPTDEVYGAWAASGEIDIMALAGQQPNVVYRMIHYGGEPPDDVQRWSSWTLPTGDFSDDFHVFAVEWQDRVMRWYVDDIHYATRTWWWTAEGSPFPAPFDQDFHILLNVAVGGMAGPPDGTTVFPQQMTVDYVRVYAADE